MAGDDDAGTSNTQEPLAVTASAPLTPETSDVDQVRGNLSNDLTESRNHERQLGQRPRYEAPFFARAVQPEIIRANQKDLYYLSQVTEQLEEVLRNVFGTRRVQAYASEISLASKMAYYGLTTLLGTQTLGEEYVDILQYDSHSRKIPTLLSRVLLLSSHVLAPFILAQIYNRSKQYFAQRHARQILAATSRMPADVHILNEEEPLFADEESSSDINLQTPETIAPAPPNPGPRFSLSASLPSSATLASLPSFETLLNDNLRAVHLAVFYLFGRYYHIAKRLLGIRYLSLHSNLSSDGQGQRPPSYEVLGVLMTVQLGVRATSAILKKRKQARIAAEANAKAAQKALGLSEKDEDLVVPQRHIAEVDGIEITQRSFDPDAVEDEEEQPEDEYEDVPQSRRCTLCLGKRKDPAATECGHCFCFECIVGWVREKPECPLCRQKVNLSRILPLYNV